MQNTLLFQVKIFVSSDPTMIRERRVLITDIFPRLVTLAGSLGLRLEMVDLFLDGSSQRKLLSQQRIRDSVNKSAGTSFLVTFLDQHTMFRRRYRQNLTDKQK